MEKSKAKVKVCRGNRRKRNEKLRKFLSRAATFALGDPKRIKKATSQVKRLVGFLNVFFKRKRHTQERKFRKLHWGNNAKLQSYEQIRGTWDEPQQIVVQDYSHAYSTRIHLSRLQTISVSRASNSYDRSWSNMITCKPSRSERLSISSKSLPARLLA